MLWGMDITPSLPMLPGPLSLGVEVPDDVPSMDQTEQCVYKWLLNWISWVTLENLKLCNYANEWVIWNRILVLNSNIWNYFTIFKNWIIGKT